MGNLFSFINDESTSQDKRKAYEEHIATLKAQEELYIKSATEAETKRNNIINDILTKRKQLNDAKLQEIKNLSQRKNERITLNLQAAQLLCCILFNYQNGHFIKDDVEWEANTVNIINVCLNESSYRLLCKISMLLPLLWPIGKDDNEAQVYSFKSTGEVDITIYNNTLNQYIKTKYISKLKTLLLNVCKSNC